MRYLTTTNPKPAASPVIRDTDNGRSKMYQTAELAAVIDRKARRYSITSLRERSGTIFS
jgi:hypothetical protein